jgi:hypothetical protein
MHLRHVFLAFLLILTPFVTEVTAQGRTKPASSHSGAIVETNEEKAARLGNQDPMKAKEYKTQKGKEEVQSVAPKPTYGCPGGKIIRIPVSGGRLVDKCVKNR